MKKIRPQFQRKYVGTGSPRNRDGRRRCAKTEALVQSSICVTSVTATGCAGNVHRTTAILTAKIILLRYAEGLLLHHMFAMAVEFGAADRTQSIITAHRSPRKATTNCCQNPAGGINKTALELDDLDRLISPLLKQGQPLSHIYATHEDEIGCSRRSIYQYLEQGAFSSGSLDLPRKVRYKSRKVRKHIEKPIPSYRVERTYKDFERYMEKHHEANC